MAVANDPTVTHMKTHTTPKYVTLAEASVYCSLSEKTLRRLISRGELPHYRPCRSVRLSLADLDQFLETTRHERVDLNELAVL